jgi:hypothetical protein
VFLITKKIFYPRLLGKIAISAKKFSKNDNKKEIYIVKGIKIKLNKRR